jgi:anti-sigma factor RsiW
MANDNTEPDAAIDPINAYLDGELGPDEAAVVESRLADDPEALARFAAYADQADLLRTGADVLDPATTTLKTAKLERDLAHALDRRARGGRHPLTLARWPVNIAAAAAMMAAGWFGNAQFGGTKSDVPAYVAEALGAHRVFAGDFIRPTEFAPGREKDIAAWLSTKLGHTVRIPRLDGLGMSLVGTRIHGTKEGPIVQAIYENADGQRLSLTMAKHPESAPAITFERVDVANKRIGYWSQGPLDYAVVADEADAKIQAIATEMQVAGKF